MDSWLGWEIPETFLMHFNFIQINTLPLTSVRKSPTLVIFCASVPTLTLIIYSCSFGNNLFITPWHQPSSTAHSKPAWLYIFWKYHSNITYKSKAGLAKKSWSPWVTFLSCPLKSGVRYVFQCVDTVGFCCHCNADFLFKNACFIFRKISSLNLFKGPSKHTLYLHYYVEVFWKAKRAA